MASNKPEVESVIEQFCSITGACRDVGKNMLEACSNNLQLAIEMHMDGGGIIPSNNEDPGPSEPSCQNKLDHQEGHDKSINASTSESESQLNSVSDDIRAPIPQKEEVLVEEAPSFGFRGRRRSARSVFDRFRDFQRETKQQEEQLYGAASSKRRTLEDLFRPPIDITYKGTFANARDAGILENKWVMVNIQNVNEFVCQTLNRDVWSSSNVKCLIKEHFIFWQVYNDSEEGKKYMQFYKVDEWPYVAIIDPRTGENMVKWTNLDGASFCNLVTEFLSMNPSLDSSWSSSPATKRKKTSSIVDADEDDQLQAAISMSLQQSSATNQRIEADHNSDSECGSDDLETFSDSDDEIHHSLKHPDNSNKTSIASGSCKKSLNHKTDSPKNKSFCDAEVLDIPKDSSPESSSFENENNVEKKAENIDVGIEEDLETNKSELTFDQNYRSYLGQDDAPVTKLLVWFPDGNKEQLIIPSSSKLMALVLFAAGKGFPNERYELVTNFPRRKISYMDLDQTIQAAGFHPQETVFVQAR